MLKRIKIYIRKHHYLAIEAIKTAITRFKMRIKSFISQPVFSQLEPFILEQLPWPVRWNDISSYNDIIVEIGTGHGENLANLASLNPASLVIGFEITKKYSKKTFNKIKEFPNALVFKGDAYPSLINQFEDGTISQIHILFPDPWHKKRHHKRRPLTTEWFEQVASKLKRDGEIFFATDWLEYYDYVKSETDNCSYHRDTGTYTPSDWGIPETHYYKKWKEEGRSFNYIRLIRS